MRRCRLPALSRSGLPSFRARPSVCWACSAMQSASAPASCATIVCACAGVSPGDCFGSCWRGRPASTRRRSSSSRARTASRALRALPGQTPSFNMSHSGELALYAIGWEREVGVDVEVQRPGRSGAGYEVEIARRFLGQPLAQRLQTLPAPRRTREFLAAWVAYEARVKCLGHGLERRAGDAADGLERGGPERASCGSRRSPSGRAPSRRWRSAAGRRRCSSGTGLASEAGSSTVQIESPGLDSHGQATKQGTCGLPDPGAEGRAQRAAPAAQRNGSSCSISRSPGAAASRGETERSRSAGHRIAMSGSFQAMPRSTAAS